MAITSLSFLLFLAVVFLIYYIVPKRFQWMVLLASSYGFYLFAGVIPLIFVVGITILTFASGIIMDNVRASAPSKKEAKRLNKKWILATIVVLLAVLFVFKYYNTAAASMNGLFSAFAWDVHAPLVNIMLPLGLSFYTFQSLGYCIDVYRGTVKAERNIAHYALFTSFFPQAIQGPIGRYNRLEPQFMSEHHFNYDAFCRGTQLMIWGYFKKLVIADRIAVIADTVFDGFAGGSYDGLQTLIAIVAYAIQIYADFSGGIDISRGAAQIFGIDMVDNFRQPYFAVSVSDFWHRWHITLGAWFRNYLFYPLAVSKLFFSIGKKIRSTKFGDTEFGQHVAKVFPTSLASFAVFMVPNLAEWFILRLVDLRFQLWDYVCMK